MFLFNLVDDARLLLGIYYHGYGNWEKIRLDQKLCLTKKIAPVTLGERETFLPRAPNLDNRASALLQKVMCSVYFVIFFSPNVYLYSFLLKMMMQFISFLAQYSMKNC